MEISIYSEWAFHDIEPIYLQLVDKIKCAIYSGQLSAGEKVPSIRIMAKILHINPNTVMRAYKIVCNEELIVSYRCDLRSLFEMRTCAITSIRDIPTTKCLVSNERCEAVGQCRQVEVTSAQLLGIDAHG